MGPENPASAEAIAALTAAVRDLGEGVATLPERLEKLEKREWRNVRAIRALVATAAVLALLLAGFAVFFALWNHSQDVSHAENRQRRDAQVAALADENTKFREGMCNASRDWQEYLKYAPQGGPAGQAAARHLVELFRSLCGR